MVSCANSIIIHTMLKTKHSLERCRKWKFDKSFSQKKKILTISQKRKSFWWSNQKNAYKAYVTILLLFRTLFVPIEYQKISTASIFLHAMKNSQSSLSQFLISYLIMKRSLIRNLKATSIWWPFWNWKYQNLNFIRPFYRQCLHFLTS